MPADTTTPTRRQLTGIELAIIEHVGYGKTNAEIGRALYRSEHTVKTHLSRISKVLGATNRMEVVRYAVQAGWLPCPNCAHTPATAKTMRSVADSLRLLAHRLDGGAV